MTWLDGKPFKLWSNCSYYKLTKQEYKVFETILRKEVDYSNNTFPYNHYFVQYFGYQNVCMDEKSIRRGHEYISMLYDGDTGHVIEVEAGRRGKSVDNLCTKVLTEEQRNSVETVCTDMWEPFIAGAVKYFPNTSHCHDLYHCVTYLNDAVDKVRKREVKEFKKLRSTKYLWLKDKYKYTPNDRR